MVKKWKLVPDGSFFSSFHIRSVNSDGILRFGSYPLTGPGELGDSRMILHLHRKLWPQITKHPECLLLSKRPFQILIVILQCIGSMKTRSLWLWSHQSSHFCFHLPRLHHASFLSLLCHPTFANPSSITTDCGKRKCVIRRRGESGGWRK